jgi:hypothetical protein
MSTTILTTSSYSFRTHETMTSSPTSMACYSSSEQGSNNDSSGSSCRRQNRIRFALFIKVLLKLIDNKLIRDQAKTIVQFSVKKNKHTRNSSSAMEEDMELSLRGLVGDSVWLCASHYTQLYFQQKKKCPSWRPSLPRSTSTDTTAGAAGTTSYSTSTAISSSSSVVGAYRVSNIHVEGDKEALLKFSPSFTTMEEESAPPSSHFSMIKDDEYYYDRSLPEPMTSLLSLPPLVRLLPARLSFPSLSSLAQSSEALDALVFQPLPAF